MPKYKKIVVGILIFTLLFIGNTIAVKAANNDEGRECTSARDTLRNLITDSYEVTKNNTYNFQLKSNKSATSNLIKMLCYRLGSGDWVCPDQKSFSFTAPSTEDKSYSVEFKFNTGDNGVNSALVKKGCKTNSSGRVAKASIAEVEIQPETTFNNQSVYDSKPCQDFRSKYTGTVFENSLPACTQVRTTEPYSTYGNETIRSWVNLIDQMASVTSSSDQIVWDPVPGATQSNGTETLKCEYYNPNTNSHTYTQIKDMSEGDCRKECREVLTVEFSPPVATQAGMCFQYVVDIKSKVECKAQYTGKLRVPKRPEVCNIVPWCVNGYTDGTHGGPLEEFDSCVQKCDGGEYSQKCINQCYEEIYDTTIEEATKKMENTKYAFRQLSDELVSYEDSEVLKVASQGCPNNISKCNYKDWDDVLAVYNRRQQNPSGYYQKTSGTWKWVQSSKKVNGVKSYHSDIAQFYFRSPRVTQTTLMLLNTFDYQDQFGYKKYKASTSGDGILMKDKQKSSPDATSVDDADCTDKCAFHNWLGCTGKDGKITTLTKEQADQEFQEAVKEYIAAKDRCEGSKPECTTEETVYTISATETVNGKDKTHNYTANQKLNQKDPLEDERGIVKQTSGTCMGGEKSPWQEDYHTKISFPKLYQNMKTGRHTPWFEGIIEEHYVYAGENFCTATNSGPVNTAWYYWKVDLGGTTPATGSLNTQIEKETITNIHSTIRNYGYLGWNFDIGCWFAQIKKPTNQDPPNSPDNPTPDCGDNCKPPEEYNDDDGKTPVNDFIFRTVSLTNLFPNREAGFNWNANSKNLIYEVDNNNKSLYPVDPESLIVDIEKNGDSIYDEDKKDEFLDYEIILDKATINQIRSYNSAQGSYYNPTTSAEKKDSVPAGVTAYTSDFLSKTISNAVKKRGLIGCNNQTSATSCKTVIVPKGGH